MIVLKYLAGRIYQTVAAVVGKMANMGLCSGQAEGIAHPSVSIFFCQDAIFPDGIKYLMGFDTLTPQLGICKGPFGEFCAGMYAYISIAVRITAADIQVFLV